MVLSVFIFRKMRQYGEFLQGIFQDNFCVCLNIQQCYFRLFFGIKSLNIFKEGKQQIKGINFKKKDSYEKKKDYVYLIINI